MARWGAIREPLGVALDDEARRLDLVVARVWVLLGTVGLLGGLTAAAVLSKPLGLGAAGISLVFLAWFSLWAYLLEKKVAGRWLRFASTIVESAVPWIVLWMLVFVQSASYALGSWLPPMLFCSLIVASVARLEPMRPLAIGVSGAVAFLTLYFLVVRGALATGQVELPLYRLPTQITRALSLVLGGGLGVLVSRGLRNVIGRAESSARAQDLFGKYRLLEKIASGGMGTVHEALYCPEGGFERRVAMKRIHPHLAEQEAFVNAFRAEAELSARLVHPNVVQVFDFGRVGDTYFLAMEYVDGLTLLAFMRRITTANERLPTWLVGHLGREILAGLTHSHSGVRASDGTPLRVIHRDLSPANVLLSKNGEVKISDFGVARVLSDAGAAQTESVAGHVGYMAPEQAKGNPFDERCDLFALGVVLWELFAGKRLFQRENQTATLFALVSEPIPKLSSLRPDLDPGWDAFFEKALARNPDERFASATDMAEGLDRMQRPGGRRDADELKAWVERALGLAERKQSDRALETATHVRTVDDDPTSIDAR
jgi:eukaryotic-like serine/threonine-protein kinase